MDSANNSYYLHQYKWVTSNITNDISFFLLSTNSKYIRLVLLEIWIWRGGGEGGGKKPNLIRVKKDFKTLWPRKNWINFYRDFMFKFTHVILGCIHIHPTLPMKDFTNDSISSLLRKLQNKWFKRLFLLGDFNVDL